MRKIVENISAFFSKLLILPVRAYKKHISPSLGNNCRFFPSCSEYMIEALTVHGPIKGLILGIWRILRCNPFGKGGIDNVPTKGKWKREQKK